MASLLLPPDEGLHSKTFVVDRQWSRIGSANLDNRSFALNHELNLTFHDRGIAEQLERIFADDLTRMHTVSRLGNIRGVAEARDRHVMELFMLPLRDQL
jgi:phosphatidylserine/phosphatidylglycerophosphate/cardiolipin synthase-like enzyme